MKFQLGAALLVSFLLAADAQPFENEDCMLCHESADDFPEDRPGLVVDLIHFDEGSHAGMECVDCHSGIEELPHPEKLAKVNCAECHEEAQEHYQDSAHGVARSVEGATSEVASCVSCHGSHDIYPSDDTRSKAHHHNLAETCVKCHQDHALIESHQLPSGETIQSYIFSVHGQSTLEEVESKAATCNDCHGWHDIRSHDDPDSRVGRHRVVETCGECHEDVKETFYESVHGRLGKENNPDVPVCTDCHGEHRIRSPQDRESTVSRYHISETCGRCHEDPEIIDKYNIPISSPSTFYRESVHGVSLLRDEGSGAAACQDCHGYHSILPGNDPASTVYRENISETCGGCHHHSGIQEEFERSVHGEALRKGVREAPVCTDCHGEHTILSHLDPNSPVYPVRLAKEVCGRCHDSLVVNRKYGLPVNQVSTYFESYHGLASRLGDTEVANCASCHGVHEILSHKDPKSSIHPDNLIETCGSCHPGASEQFVAGLVHVSPKEPDHRVIYWIRIVYMAVIVLTIGGMLLHNLLIMGRHIRDKYRSQKHVPRVQRFPGVALAQHVLLSVAFIILVISGFSLSFPDSLFSRMMAQYLFLGEGQRSLVHRIAGVALILTIIWHLATMVLTKRGRQEFGYLWLKWRDLRDAFQNVFYHLGLAKSRPRFDRFDYSEKLEYWAFLWGTVVMILTGLLMWFPAQFSQTLGLSRLWVDAASVIHYYEAWLATLAILIWHFFFVVFHPEEYPMALSWVTGELSVESMKERHPEELARLVQEGKIQLPPSQEEDSEGPSMETDSK
jgi:cytochrome b subunit of formate dehydrogenase/nitrate/TMAO reductase-like tetraheme cytochrome c subunit